MRDQSGNLIFSAGRSAFTELRQHGFGPELIGTIAGASGGAKWLVLSQLDRAIISEILPRLKAPVHLIGSSIGAWRFACYAQADPLAAIERFEEAYISQVYSESPDRDEITARTVEILHTLLGERGKQEILDHPTLRMNIMTVRARHLAASEKPLLLGTGLLLAASLNAVSRRTLGWFFERALLYDARDLPPFFELRGFPLQRISLTQDNIEAAIVASGAIPLILNGVEDIDGGQRGVYRDGGVIDYHLDLPQSAAGRFALYPHFFGHLVPGWFDKRLPWRRARPEHVDRTILISPSPEYVARLPGGKIPDRSDFQRYTTSERIAIWRQVVAECEGLAEELTDVLENQKLPARLRAL